jgi:hypothetical protein
MATFNVKLISVTKTDKGEVIISVEISDGVSKWPKTYIYNQTNPITLTSFKDRITSELRRDTKLDNRLVEIQPLIGKSFNLII